jgi:multidrug efflux pump subunit AcrA (membrane-fusion protein)
MKVDRATHIVISCFLLLAGCGSEPEHDESTDHQTPSNRIQLTQETINNLGITFETATSGKLGSWIAIPGKMEIPREYRFKLKAPCRGRIFWKKERLSWIEKGEVIAVIETEKLSELQQQLEESDQTLQLVAKLYPTEESSSLRKIQAEREHHKRMGELSVLTGYSTEELIAKDPATEESFWRTLTKLEVKARGEGILADLQVADGEILDSGAELGIVINTDKILFRALVSAEHFAMLSEQGVIQIITPDQRTLDLRLKNRLPISDPETFKVWVEAELCNKNKTLVDGAKVLSQIQIAESAMEETLIPKSSVGFDQLEAIVFKRDPNDSNYVIRTTVELGNKSGGKVEILSGLLEGDEVVTEGIHLLMQLATKSPEINGHFHADGTFHEGEH